MCCAFISNDNYDNILLNKISMPTGRTDWRKIMYIISAVVEKNQSKVALFDKEYKFLAKKEGAVADVAGLCSEIITEAGINASDVAYAGVAADEILSGLEEKLGVRVLGTTLINAKALGEAYELNDADTLVIVKIDETVECGIIMDKKAYTGAHNQSAKLAHMVIGFGGYECTCGRRGCFEAYASISGLNRIAAESGVAGAGELTHAQLFAMDTPEAKSAQKLYVEYLASGITNIVNLFQPRHLVLDGAFTKVGDALMTPVIDIILRDQYTHSNPNKCEIRFANTEADTALLGAALLGR